MSSSSSSLVPFSASQFDLGVGGAKWVELPHIVDLRGSLSFAEVGQLLPFTPQRYFIIFDVPTREVRGEHAHRQCEQFLICVRGRCSVVADDGQRRVEIHLDRPTLGLYLPAMIWSVQTNYSADAVLLALASRPYEAEDYIRDYETFLRERAHV